MPQSAAGCRIDPPVSVPQAHGAPPAATIAAEPALDPPGTRSKSQGFLVGLKPEFSPEEPMANSSMLSFPRRGRPASEQRATTVASYGGTYPSRIFEPEVDVIPFVTNRSL